MTKKITEITKEQEPILDEKKEYWISRGLCCDPANRPRAEAGIRKSYEIVGLEPPKYIVWAASPIQGINYRKLMPAVLAELLEGIQPKSKDEAYERVREQLMTQIDPKDLAKTVSKKPPVAEEEWAKEWWRYIGGCHWSGFVAWADTLEALGASIPAIDGFREVAESASWWWPHEGWAVVTDRPAEIHMEDGVMHSAHGPAIKWRDGWSIYVWRGTRVPQEWIEDPGSVDPTLALSWENIEQRRALCEILGWDTVLASLDHRIIDQDDDPQIGTLFEVNLPDSGKERFIRVLCGTGRQFVLPVPNEMKTALEANAWTYGIADKDLNVEVRT